MRVIRSGKFTLRPVEGLTVRWALYSYGLLVKDDIVDVDLRHIARLCAKALKHRRKAKGAK